MGREDFLSAHRCHHPEIDLTGPDTATGTWALDDVVIIGEHDLLLHGAAFYEDRYRKIEGTWYFAHTGYERTFEQLVPRASIEGLTLTASWWGTNGRSTLPAD
ncbi:MAG: nuclear transport factor 2 family protein [Acidimicrobiia bacterium]|nr:nuclear transport factor 2 family protein [Acidimicrobiia bacterium]